MESDDLIIYNLTNNERMADTFRNAILYAFPELEGLTVSYNGEYLTFDFIGKPFKKAEVLILVNKLVNSVTQKRIDKNDQVDKVIKNTADIMSSTDIGAAFPGKITFPSLINEEKSRTFVKNYYTWTNMSDMENHQIEKLQIKAPFTDEQVTALNEYQHSGLFHEFTCGNEDHPPGKDNILIATKNGWICPHCNYTQAWAWKFMTTGKAAAALDDWKEKHGLSKKK